MHILGELSWSCDIGKKCLLKNSQLKNSTHDCCFSAHVCSVYFVLKGA